MQHDLNKGWIDKRIPGGMDALQKWMIIQFTSKAFLRIFAAKWLVRHSSMSLNQQRRPLPSLLSDSYSLEKGNIGDWTVNSRDSGKVVDQAVILASYARLLALAEGWSIGL